MIINMVGGGGGFSASNAILGVTAYAGSVVTISNGTVTKTVTPDKSHLLSNLNDWAIYYFGIPSSMFSSSIPWNIVATYQTEQTTGTVIINTNAFYDIELTYIVPYDYQQVEYLESNGNQYIDTLVKMDNIGLLNCKFMFLNNDFIIDPRFAFGGTTGLKSYGAVTTGGFGWNSYTHTFSINGDDYFYNYSQGIIIDMTLSFLNDNKYVTANGVSQQVYSANPIYNGNFYIFTFHFSDGVILTDQNNNRFYECEIFNYNNQKIANLIPCYRKIGRVAGMYDNVNKRFLTNQGTGTFIVGSDVI